MLVSTIRRWLRQRRSPPVLFLEPFAGGGSVSLAVAGERLAEHVLMVERDHDVSAVWTTILIGEAEAFAARIRAFDFSYLAAYTPAQLQALLAVTPPPALGPTAETADAAREIAFRTLLRNRLAYGGLLTADAGRLRQGEHGRGLASRRYPATLRHRILAIRHLADHITPILFVEGDGMAVLRAHADTPAGGLPGPALHRWRPGQTCGPATLHALGARS